MFILGRRVGRVIIMSSSKAVRTDSCKIFPSVEHKTYLAQSFHRQSVGNCILNFSWQLLLPSSTLPLGNKIEVTDKLDISMQIDI